MAHFAKISETNQVLDVLTLDNVNMLDSNGVESELIGQQYLETHNNWPAHLWIQTSYWTYKNVHNEGRTAFRGNFAGIGNEWDLTNQVFWPSQPYPSWVKHVETASWKSPVGDVPELTAEQITQNTPPNINTPATNHWTYDWNESDQSWDLSDVLDLSNTLYNPPED